MHDFCAYLYQSTFSNDVNCVTRWWSFSRLYSASIVNNSFQNLMSKTWWYPFTKIESDLSSFSSKIYFLRYLYVLMYIIYINKLVNMSILLNELRKLHFLLYRKCLTLIIVVFSFHLGFRTILGHDWDSLRLKFFIICSGQLMVLETDFSSSCLESLSS